MNIKVFKLMSRTNETRYVSWHETCTCKCRLDTSVCNNKQYWNSYKCGCECKKLINKGKCDDRFIWSPSTCECDKSADVEEYLDYANCKCTKILIDKVVEECSENIDDNELVYKATLNDYGKVSSSSTLYRILLTIIFIIGICISSTFFIFVGT